MVKVLIQYRHPHALPALKASQETSTIPSPVAASPSKKRMKYGHWQFMEPPLNVLQDPNHIVICSNLSSKTLKGLLHFIVPLRGNSGVTSNPPITILDQRYPDQDSWTVLQSFPHVYYVHGNSIHYRALQRAGAKSASSVVILPKHSNLQQLQKTLVSDKNLCISRTMADAEAIFTTMLVEFKLNPTSIFTMTELVDESNAKYIGTINSSSNNGCCSELEQAQKDHSFIKTALRTEAYRDKNETALYEIPRYRSGRLFHPNLCDVLLVQTYFNPSIHRIIRQFSGGPESTGTVSLYHLPHLYTKMHISYGSMFEYFANTTYSGICCGIYRQSADHVDDKDGFPFVIANPRASLEVKR